MPGSVAVSLKVLVAAVHPPRAGCDLLEPYFLGVGEFPALVVWLGGGVVVWCGVVGGVGGGGGVAPWVAFVLAGPVVRQGL